MPNVGCTYNIWQNKPINAITRRAIRCVQKYSEACDIVTIHMIYASLSLEKNHFG